MSYNFYKTYSIFWMKDPTATDHRKRRPMVILWKKNDQYFLAKISTKYKDKNRYCCILDDWFEAGLEKPSCVRLDKLVNCTESMLSKKDYVGLLSEEDSLMVRSMLESLYKIERPYV